MRIRAGGFAAIAVLAAFCLALPALSQDVTVGYTGGYSAVWGSEGAGTYNGTLNGAPLRSYATTSRTQSALAKPGPRPY